MGCKPRNSRFKLRVPTTSSYDGSDTFLVFVLINAYVEDANLLCNNINLLTILPMQQIPLQISWHELINITSCNLLQFYNATILLLLTMLSMQQLPL